MEIKEKYDYYKSKYNNIIVFIRNGRFYNTYKDDAIILWSELGYKLHNESTGFSIINSNKVLSKIKSKALGYVLINDDEEIVYDNNQEIYNMYLNIAKIKYDKYNKRNIIHNLLDDILNNNEELYEVIYENPDFLYTSIEKCTRKVQENDKKCTRNKISVQENLILNYCNEPKSLKEITIHFGFKSIRYFKKIYINPLINKSKLIMTMPNQPYNRNQKYVKI